MARFLIAEIGCRCRLVSLHLSPFIAFHLSPSVGSCVSEDCLPLWFRSWLPLIPAWFPPWLLLPPCLPSSSPFDCLEARNARRRLRVIVSMFRCEVFWKSKTHYGRPEWMVGEHLRICTEKVLLYEYFKARFAFSSSEMLSGVYAGVIFKPCIKDDGPLPQVFVWTKLRYAAETCIFEPLAWINFDILLLYRSRERLLVVMVV